MIHRNIKVTHGLPWMKVTSKNTICPSFCNKVSNKFSCNRFTPLSLLRKTTTNTSLIAYKHERGTVSGQCRQIHHKSLNKITQFLHILAFLSALAYPKYGITAVIFLADALRQASIITWSSMRFSLAGGQVGCIRYTLQPLTLSCNWT